MKTLYLLPVIKGDGKHDNEWLDYLTKSNAIAAATNGDSIYKVNLIKIGKVKDEKFIPIKRRKK